MSNITSILEKLWKKIYRIAIIRSKDPSPYYILKEYHQIFDILDKLKIETRKLIEIIKKNLLRSRPILINRQLLEDYIKRIEYANEIILNLDILLTKTFTTFIEFINIYWEIKENFDINEQQKILSEKYDMSLTEWQCIINKIERFNDIIKNLI